MHELSARQHGSTEVAIIEEIECLASKTIHHVNRTSAYKPSFFRRITKNDVVLTLTTVAIVTYIISLFFPPSSADTVLKALTVMAAGITFAIGYMQWHLARHEISFDKFYERINVTNHYISLSGVEEAGNNIEQKIDHLRNMRVFVQLDNLEYIVGKYRLNFVEFDLVDRAIRTFRSECDQDWFRGKTRHWLKHAKGYHKDTRVAAEYIITQSEN